MTAMTIRVDVPTRWWSELGAGLMVEEAIGAVIVRFGLRWEPQVMLYSTDHDRLAMALPGARCWDTEDPAARCTLTERCARLATRHRAALITAADASALRDSLVTAGVSDPALLSEVSVAEWTAVARAVVTVGASLADVGDAGPEVARCLAAGGSAADVAEVVIAAVGRPTIEIQVAEACARDLPWDGPSAFADERERLFWDLGWKFPDVRLTIDPDAAPDRVVFVICGVPVERTYTGGVTAPASWIASALGVELRRDCHRFVSVDAVGELLEESAALAPRALATARHRHSIETITAVLRALLYEGISIRNLRRILEALGDFDQIVVDQHLLIVLDDRLCVAELVPEEPRYLVPFVRSQLRDQISHRYKLEGNTLNVYLLEPSIEQALASNRPVDDELVERLHDVVRAELADRHEPSAVVLTTADVRPTLRYVLETEFPELAVLAYTELTLDLNIRPLARLG